MRKHTRRSLRRILAVMFSSTLLVSAGCGVSAPSGNGNAAPANSNSTGVEGATAHVDATGTLPYDLVAVDFVSNATGFLVGNDGENNVSVICRTVNGGATWVAVLEIVGESLLDVDFVDEEKGWAVGAEGLIYATADGGKSWTEESPATGWKVQRVTEPVTVRPKTGDGSGPPMITSESIASVFFIDSRTGWAAGDVPTGESVDVRGIVLGTKDGGASWTELKQPDGAPVIPVAVNDVHFVSRNEGWAAAGNLENGEEDMLFHTTDGGSTWARQPAVGGQYLRAVHFVSPTRGFAVGMTIDSVTELPGPSKILSTTDGGATWKVALVAERSFFDVTFVDSNRGWAVGDRASVYATTDGGATWKQQSKFVVTDVPNRQRPPKRPGAPTARAFRTVLALSAADVWAAGEGQILRRK
ncbi:MAG: hypothetical protein IT175_07960 [Acidobacteria bacterium]|nr:hypothetical protein [Acidobacteriota bacterium]